MARPACEACRAMGYGECDECGNPTFDGGDLCGYCRGDDDQGDEDDPLIVIGEP